MATYYEREHKMNQQVGNSMMYPLILCVLIVAVIAILMTFVLPQFKPMFDQMEKLPFLTQLLFDASDFVGANWPLLLVALALIFFGFKLLLAPAPSAASGTAFILHAPVVGVLNPQDLPPACQHPVQPVRQRCAHHPTLGAARDSIGNRWIESQFGTALDSIRAGHSLSQSIAAIDGFEVKLASSIAVGEETGKLDSLLATISRDARLRGRDGHQAPCHPAGACDDRHHGSGGRRRCGGCYRADLPVLRHHRRIVRRHLNYIRRVPHGIYLFYICAAARCTPRWAAPLPRAHGSPPQQQPSCPRAA